MAEDIRKIAEGIAKKHNLSSYFIKIILWQDGSEEITIESNERNKKYDIRIGICKDTII